jgi:hypothetical protein
MRPFFTLLPVFALSLGVAEAQTPAQLELFEKNARPLFAEKCQGCHNAKLKSGGIDFSSPGSIKEAASMGIFGSPAEPEKSVIIRLSAMKATSRCPRKANCPPKPSPLFANG